MILDGSLRGHEGAGLRLVDWPLTSFDREGRGSGRAACLKNGSDTGSTVVDDTHRNPQRIHDCTRENSNVACMSEAESTLHYGDDFEIVRAGFLTFLNESEFLVGEEIHDGCPGIGCPKKQVGVDLRNNE